MTAEPNQPGKTAVDKHVATEINPATGAPMWPANYAPADEIDLVDLGVMFWRRRWVIAWVAGVLIVLSILAAIFKSPTYEYTTTVELGSMVSQTGTPVAVMDAQSAANMLQNSYIPAALAQYAQETGLSAFIPKVTVTGVNASANGSTALILACKAKEKLSVACTSVEQNAAQQFVKNNSRGIETLRANLQADLSSAKIDLQGLQNPAVFGVQKLAAEKAIADARAALATLQSAAGVLQVKKSKLQASTELYQKQADELQAHIADVRKAGIDSARQTSDPTQAMANLLLGTETQRSVNLLSDIQQKLTVTLPDQLATVDKNIADNARNQALQRQVISQNELALQKLLFSHGQDIQSQNVTIGKLQTQLANVQDTRVLGDALRSVKPVGLSRGAILAVGIIISLLLGFFAAMAAGYVEQVRARLGSDKIAP